MEKINNIVFKSADAALKRRAEAEIKLLAILGECEAELFDEFVDAWMEYEDCLLGVGICYKINSLCPTK